VNDDCWHRQRASAQSSESTPMQQSGSGGKAKTAGVPEVVVARSASVVSEVVVARSVTGEVSFFNGHEG